MGICVRLYYTCSSVFGSISDIGTTGSTIMRSIDSQQTGRKTKGWLFLIWKYAILH